MVRDETAIDNGEAYIKEANTRKELNCQRSRKRLTLRYRPTVECHAGTAVSNCMNDRCESRRTCRGSLARIILILILWTSSASAAHLAITPTIMGCHLI